MTAVIVQFRRKDQPADESSEAAVSVGVKCPADGANGASDQVAKKRSNDDASRDDDKEADAADGDDNRECKRLKTDTESNNEATPSVETTTT